MSRCFPFPPPGYEKKARADEENLLNKEKPKDKKHKKEKKDREKREGKEKERNEEKHKGKKERKDKHKDKKDKHKDKERKSVSVEKDTARPPEQGTTEKLGPSLVHSAPNNDANFILELGKRIGNGDERSAERNLLVHKFTLTGQGKYEMPGKGKGEDQGKINGRQNGVVAENGFIQKFEAVHQRTIEGMGGVVEKSVEKQRAQEENNKPNNDERRDGEQKERDSGKKIRVGLLVERPIKKRTEQKNGDSGDTKFLLELGKRIGNNDERSAEKNLLVHKFTLNGQGNYEMPGKDTGDDQRKVNGRQNGVVAANGFIQKLEGVHQKTLEGVGGLMENSAEKRRERDENNKQINGVVAANGFIQKLEGVHQKTLEGVGGLMENSAEKRRERDENNKQINGESRNREQKERDSGKKIGVGLHKDKDGERKSKSKDKKRDKEKEKEERKMEKKKERKMEKKKEKELKKELLKQRENGKPAADGDNMKTASDLLKERSGGEGNVGKRKELETNGFLHDTGTRPSKLLRPASSTHQIVENGRMTEPFKPAIRFVEDLKGNKKISSSPSVPTNGRISDQSLQAISSTHQIVVNGKRPEPSKTAIRIVAEFGEGNKKVTTSLSVAGNGNEMEPCPGPKPVDSIKENVANGRKPEKAGGFVGAEGEGNKNKVISSISFAETRSKMEPPTPSLPAPENGRKLELSRSIDQSTSGGNVVIINQKGGNSKEIMNGKHDGQQLSVSLKRPSPSLKQVKEKFKSKPPHPDSKFLDSIFSVPKVELTDLVDQEWLFGSSNLQEAKRSKTGPSQVKESTKQVWAEALRLEYADIIALPYVIHY